MSLSVRKPNEDELRAAADDLRSGSAAAFQVLYKQYSHSVYRFCLRMLGDSAIAQDAFQETFMKVYEHHAEFRGDHFPSWLFTIARRVCLNHLRSVKDHDIFDEEAHSSAPIQSTSDVGIQMYVHNALINLPLQLREAVILREYEGYSYQEIATIVGIDISLAKVRVHRARLILRKLLAPVMQEWYES
jgi:RNA polymerase sigma-70 factor (ECF subfamily)